MHIDVFNDIAHVDGLVVAANVVDINGLIKIINAAYMGQWLVDVDIVFIVRFLGQLQIDFSENFRSIAEGVHHEHLVVAKTTDARPAAITAFAENILVIRPFVDDIFLALLVAAMNFIDKIADDEVGLKAVFIFKVGNQAKQFTQPLCSKVVITVENFKPGCGSQLNTHVDTGAMAPVFLIDEAKVLWPAVDVALANLSRAVNRAIIDNNDVKLFLMWQETVQTTSQIVLRVI